MSRLSNPTPFAPSKRLHVLILIVILVIGACFYLYRLERESLTTDEYFSLYVATSPIGDTFSTVARHYNPNTLPPLYETLLHYWLRLFGESEYAQRSLSAVFGIASIFLLYLLTRLVFDASTGLLAAMLGGCSSSWFLIFRQNRCYSLLLLLALLSVYLFLYCMRRRDSEGAFFSLLLTNAALIYTHYFGVLVIGLELLFSVLEWKRDRALTLRMALLSGVLLLLYAPWYGNLLLDLQREPLFAENARYYTSWYLLFRMTMTLLSDLHIRWEPLLTLLYLPFLCLGLIRALRDKDGQQRYGAWFLALFFILPTIFIFARTHSDRLRYYAPFAFPLLIFLAYGLRQLAGVKRRRLMILPLAAVVGALNITDMHDYFTARLHEDWREAARVIKSVPHYENKEMVFFFQTKYNPPVFAYYFWGKDIAASCIDNIVSGESYDGDIKGASPRHHIFVSSEEEGIEGFYRALSLLPKGAWVWVFRYRDHFFSNEFRMRNGGRYFFHSIPLNKELPQIDFYLIRKLS